MLSALASSLFGAYGFDEVAVLATEHPEYFVPGRVSVVTNAGTAYYVTCGEARQWAKGADARSRTMLRQRAELQAKASLLKKMAPSEGRWTLELSGFLSIGKQYDADVVRYVFAVPRDGVSIVKAEEKTIASEPVEVASGSAASLGEDFLSLCDRVEQNPDDGDALVKLARLYFQSGCTEEAVATARKAKPLLLKAAETDKLPKNFEHLYDVAVLFFDCKEYELARECYQNLSEISAAEWKMKAFLGITACDRRLKK